MKKMNPRPACRIEDLVAAAYKAACQATPDRLLAAIIASKILEDCLLKSGRMDLLARLQNLFL